MYGDADRALVTQFVEPWSTELPLRPWVVPPLQAPKTYAHASLVAPPCYDTMPASVTVDEGTNPGNVIRFQDVYSGRTFARAACFRVFGRGNLSFSIVNGPTSPYTVLTPGGAVRSLHAPTLYQEVRIWFGYTGGAPGDVAPMGTVVIRCDDTGEEFEFTLQANSVALPFSATAKEPDRVGGSAAPGLLSCSQLVGVTWTWTWRALACPPSAGRAATDAAHLSRATGRAIW